MKRNIAIIQHYLNPDELLAQLAEETAELGKASLKLRRTIIPDNPTPVTHDEAYANLLEECADISLVLKVLGFDNPIDLLRVDQIVREKAERWAKRLQEGKC